MLLHEFQNGDRLDRRNQALILSFAGPRDVLSTSPVHGGLSTHLRHVFNHDCKQDGDKNTPLKAATYAAHMEIIARELGLEPRYVCGLSTAADMENAAIESQSYEDLTVTAIVTGGIHENGGRVGDPAAWHEAQGGSIRAFGTINIMLHIDARLPAGISARALVTCTEAKTAALQELAAPSLYSSGLATGSGTDGTIVISNPASPLCLTYAGKHSKLGELIGRTVLRAVKTALYLESGLCAAQQFDIFSRIGRYGLTKERILAALPESQRGRLDEVVRRRDLVVMTALYVHLLDELQWGLLSWEDARPAAIALLRDAGMETGFAAFSQGESAEEQLIAAYQGGLVRLLSLR